ncbi:hypothetical protein MKX01_023290 [Papaver californicum]|nr:hypothetical protein MKX01_023290 [Papaver californicum]
MAQLREQSELDENGLDEDGNQQSISDEVFVNVVPTGRQKCVRAQRCLSYLWSSAKDLERSLADSRSNSLDLLRRFICLRSSSTDLKMIISISSLIFNS